MKLDIIAEYQSISIKNRRAFIRFYFGLDAEDKAKLHRHIAKRFMENRRRPRPAIRKAA
jgi:hypothetical protein